MNDGKNIFFKYNKDRTKEFLCKCFSINHFPVQSDFLWGKHRLRHGKKEERKQEVFKLILQ